MIELVLGCIIAGHKEIGPSLYETDLVCPQFNLVFTFQSGRLGRPSRNERPFDTRPAVSSRRGLSL